MSATFPADAIARPEAKNSVLALACLLLAVALPACVFYYLLTSPAHVLATSLGGSAAEVSSPDFQMRYSHRALLVAIAIVPASCMAVALLYVRRCFLSFARGQYFTSQVVQGLRGFAGATFCSGLTGLAAAPLASLLSSALRGGGMSISVNVSSNQLLLLLFAGIVWQIAAVMSKAVALADENAQFV